MRVRICQGRATFSNDLSYFRVGVIVVFLLYAGVIAVGFWVLYQVVWPAVRRGLREFHGPARE